MAKAPTRSGLAFPLFKQNSNFKDANLIDLGCGNGNLITHFLSQPFAQWVGIDGGKSVIESATNFINDKRVTLKHADITDELDQCLKTQFDVATNFFVLEEIPNHKMNKLFQNIANVLKAHGEAHIFCNHPINVMMEDLNSVNTGNENRKFPNNKGYFDRQETVYKLQVLNQEQGSQSSPSYHHKTISDIINAAVISGLHLQKMYEIPKGVITLDALDRHEPRQGDSPRFLYMKLHK